MKGRIGAILLVMAMLFVRPASAQQGNLIMAFGDFNERPYAIVVNGELQGGFLRDLGLALAGQLDRAAVFRHLPRNRIGPELMSGAIDAYCMASPKFYPGFAISAFSTPLFIDDDLVIFARNFTGPATLDGLRGARIGTVLGYLYPAAVEDLFNAGRAVREDARSAEANLRKLAGGRVDAVIVPALTWGDAVARDPALARTAAPERVVLARNIRTCLVSPVGSVDVASVNLALAALERSGALPAMVRRHGLSTVGALEPEAQAADAAHHLSPASRQYR